MQYQLTTLEDTANLAQSIVRCITYPFVITFSGQLGAGKTALIRFILQALGVISTVKSPTYTLVESYPLGQINLHHFDLYRFADESEWLDLGFDEYFTKDAMCFIEWPSKAGRAIKHIDWHIEINITPQQDRIVSITAFTPKGQACLSQLIV